MKSVVDGNEVPDDMDYSDPTTKFKNLIPLEEADDAYPDVAAYPAYHGELCWSCGWNSRNQRLSSYGSRVRILHAKRNHGIWTIGDRWVLKDEPNDLYLGNNFMTLKFLHKQPGLTIPIPKEVRSLSKQGDPIYFALESRVPGDVLAKILPTLSKEETQNYAHQLADVIRQLQRFTAPRPQKVDGSKLSDGVIAQCREAGAGNCFEIGYTVDEWLETLRPDILVGLADVHETTDLAFLQEKFQKIKDEFPPFGPCVLTHADLNPSNIIVKDGKIQGIIDWERSGYYPWWMERYLSYRIPDDNSMDLIDMVWDELMPDLPYERFEKQYCDKVYPFMQAFMRCHHDHELPKRGWLKPPFCKCRPHMGVLKGYLWGFQPLSCTIRSGPPERQALIDRLDRKNPWATKSKEAAEASTERAKEEDLQRKEDK